MENCSTFVPPFKVFKQSISVILKISYLSGSVQFSGV